MSVLLIIGAYLAAGLVNAAFGPLLHWHGEHGLEAWVELGFYLLLWPAQILFQTLVCIHAATGRVLERMFR